MQRNAISGSPPKCKNVLSIYIIYTVFFSSKSMNHLKVSLSTVWF